MTEKSEAWLIDARVTVQKDVVFDEPVTQEEAKELFEAGEHYDIVDEEELDLIDVKVRRAIG